MTMFIAAADLTEARKIEDAIKLSFATFPRSETAAKNLNPSIAKNIRLDPSTVQTSGTPVQVFRSGSSYVVAVYGGAVAEAASGVVRRYRRLDTKQRLNLRLADYLANATTRLPAGTWTLQGDLAQIFTGEDTDGALDHILWCGDSIMLGDTDSPVYAPSISPDPDIPAYYDGGGVTPQNWNESKVGGAGLDGAASPANSQVALQAPSQRWSGDLKLASLMKANGWKPAIIKPARGGSAMGWEWTKGSGAVQDMATISEDLALKAISELGVPRRAVWIHGTGVNCATQDRDFLAGARLRRTAYREIYGDSLVCYCVILHSSWNTGSYPHYSRVRSEQLQFVAEDARTFPLYLDDVSTLISPASIFQGTDDSPADYTHLNGDGSDALGEVFYNDLAARESTLW